MSFKPLRLRLRITHVKLSEPHQYCIAGSLDKYGEPLMPAVLEFENPIDGSWHPVEVVTDP